MTRKTKRPTTEKGFPIDERPVIFNLKETTDINFVGRYIESDAMFMLSLNDDESDFVPQTEINEWWYIDQHPTIVKEVLNTKSLKKDKIKKKDSPKYKRNAGDSENKTDSDVTSDTQSFSAPPLPPLPPFLKGFVENIQRETGMQFQAINVRVVGEDDLHSLPIEVLQQILKNAEQEEHWELAIKVRDAINDKK